MLSKRNMPFLRYKKICSCFLMFLFLLPDEPYLFANSPPNLSPQNQIDLPPELGTVQEHAPPGNQPLIIHIQDAHASLAAQESIEKILDYLTQKYAIQNIFLEGTVGNLSSKSFRFFEKSDLNIKLAQLLVRDGLMGGAEFFLTHQSVKVDPNPVSAHGIENALLYQQNLETFKQVLEQKPLTDLFLNRTKSLLTTQASHVFNDPLKKFFKSWLFQDHNQFDLLAQLNLLQEHALKEFNLDFYNIKNQPEWPELVRFFKLERWESRLNETAAKEEIEKLIEILRSDEISNQKITGELKRLLNNEPLDNKTAFVREIVQIFSKQNISFHDFPNLTFEIGMSCLKNEINADELYREIDRLTDLLLDHYVRSESEKILVGTFKDLKLVGKLLSLELSREEYLEVLEKIPVLKPSLLVKRIKLAHQKNAQINSKMELDVDPLFSQALFFYQVAENREKAMAENLLSKMEQTNQSKAILITGGFHSSGLQNLFQQKNVHYLNVVPRISNIEEKNPYLKTMLNQGDYFTLRSYVKSLGLWQIPGARRSFIPGDALDDVMRDRLLVLNADLATVIAGELKQKPGRDKRPDFLQFLLEINESRAARELGFFYTPKGILVYQSQPIMDSKQKGFVGISLKGPKIFSPKDVDLSAALSRSELRNYRERIALVHKKLEAVIKEEGSQHGISYYQALLKQLGRISSSGNLTEFMTHLNFLAAFEAASFRPVSVDASGYGEPPPSTQSKLSRIDLEMALPLMLIEKYGLKQQTIIFASSRAVLFWALITGELSRTGATQTDGFHTIFADEDGNTKSVIAVRSDLSEADTLAVMAREIVAAQQSPEIDQVVHSSNPMRRSLLNGSRYYLEHQFVLDMRNTSSPLGEALRTLLQKIYSEYTHHLSHALPSTPTADDKVDLAIHSGVDDLSIPHELDFAFVLKKVFSEAPIEALYKNANIEPLRTAFGTERFDAMEAFFNAWIQNSRLTSAYEEFPALYAAAFQIINTVIFNWIWDGPSRKGQITGLNPDYQSSWGVSLLTFTGIAARVIFQNNLKPNPFHNVALGQAALQFVKGEISIEKLPSKLIPILSPSPILRYSELRETSTAQRIQANDESLSASRKEGEISLSRLLGLSLASLPLDLVSILVPEGLTDLSVKSVKLQAKPFDRLRAHPEKLDTLFFRGVVVLPELPKVNDPVIQVLVDLLSPSRSGGFMIVILNTNADFNALRAQMMEQIQTRRRALGNQNPNVNLSFTHDESKIGHFIHPGISRSMVLDSRKNALRALADRLKENHHTLLAFDDTKSPASALRTAVHMALEQPNLFGIHPVSELRRLLENLGIASGAERRIRQAA